ncbi:MAG: tetratricopeptide repeat protein [Clostridiales bacterium]|nr:tetratricopeptide repeat protein [Clostridiales bacterium]
MGFIGNINGFLGYMYHIRGNVEKAKIYYKKGMDKDMTNPSYKLAYGVILLKSGEFKDARDVFRDVLLNREYKEQIRYMGKMNLSLAYWKLGEIDTAIEMLKELHQKYRNSRIYGALGYLLIEKGDMKEALDYNLEALDYDDEDPVVLDNLGQTYYRMGRIDEAKKYFLKAESIKDDQAATLYHLGCIYQQAGDNDKAKEKFLKALDCNINPLTTISREDIERKLAELDSNQ